jgi:hypothetical protein
MNKVRLSYEGSFRLWFDWVELLSQLTFKPREWRKLRAYELQHFWHFRTPHATKSW